MINIIIKVLKYSIEGYIPIIDLKSYPNIINGFDTKKNIIKSSFINEIFS